MRQIGYLLLIMCLLFAVCGCGRTPQPTGVAAPGTTLTSSIVTELSTESSPTETTEELQKYPLTLAFEAHEILDPERWEQARDIYTPELTLIRSGEAFSELCDIIKEEDPEPQRSAEIDRLADTYNYDYFKTADLIILRAYHSPDDPFSIEELSLSDEKLLTLLYCTTSQTAGYLTGSDNDPKYQRYAIALDRKLPAEPDVLLIDRNSNRNTVDLPPEYLKIAYPEGYGTYSVTCDGLYMDAVLTQERLAMLLAAATPESVTDNPFDTAKVTQRPTYRSYPLLSGEYMDESLRDLQIIRSVEELEQYGQQLRAEQPDSLERSCQIDTFIQTYDHSYFETGCLVLLKERLRTDADSLSVEKVEYLDDGSLRVQTHRVSVTDNTSHMPEAVPYQRYVIELEQHIPEDLKILYVCRIETFLSDQAYANHWGEVYPFRITAYSMAFLEMVCQ